MSLLSRGCYVLATGKLSRLNSAFCTKVNINSYWEMRNLDFSAFSQGSEDAGLSKGLGKGRGRATGMSVVRTAPGSRVTPTRLAPPG